MKKSKLVLICALCMTVFLGGCSGYTEIENMDILTSHFVYMADGRIQVGGGVANIPRFSDSAPDAVSYIYASGDSLADALIALKRSAEHKIFYGGTRAVIIGDLYARSGVGEFVRYLRSEPEQRMNVDVFTSQNEPEDIVNYKAANDFSGGFCAESIIHTLDTEGLAVRCRLGDILAASAERSVGFAVPDIIIENDIMRIDGYSIFDGERKIGFIDENNTASLGCFIGRNAKEICRADAGGRSVVLEANMAKRNIRVDTKDDGKISVRADFVFDLTAADTSSATLFEDEKKALAAQAEEQLKDSITYLLNTAKEYECDFLGLYKIYQTKHRAEFYSIDWRRKIAEMDYTVSVSIGKFESNMTNEQLWRR